MNDKVCIGIIGCGRIAQGAHFPALSVLKGVRVKWACDLIIEKAARMREKYANLIENITTDYREILKDEEVSAVFVLTSNYEHYTIAMDALRAGKHVFCEKPITVNYPLSLEMAAAARENGKQLQIGVCNRFHKSVEILEQMNRAGEFGNLYHVYCSFRRYRGIPGLGGAFTNKAQSGGGVLIDVGIHFFDLVLYILGGASIQTVTCDVYNEMAKNMKEYVYTNMHAEDTKNLDGVNDVDDFVSGYIRTNKASLSFNGAWAQNIGEEEAYIDFLGDKGGARLNYCGYFTFWTTENGMLETKKLAYNIPDMYEREDEAFLNSVRTGEKTKGDISKVLESAKLIDALYESASRKRELSF